MNLQDIRSNNMHQDEANTMETVCSADGGTTLALVVFEEKEKEESASEESMHTPQVDNDNKTKITSIHTPEKEKKNEKKEVSETKDTRQDKCTTDGGTLLTMLLSIGNNELSC